MALKVVIPAAGIGSRLGSATKYIPKALVAVHNRPLISYIIDSYPNDTNFVIGLGYKGELIREYISLAYSENERRFAFCNVDIYSGPGSGIGRTLLACSGHLDVPFIMHSCDTLVKNRIPTPDYNWMGISQTNDLNSYRMVNRVDKKWILHEKSSCKSHPAWAYIGLCGIKDSEDFWDCIKDIVSKETNSGEAEVLQNMCRESRIECINFDWCDAGNTESMKQAEKFLNSDCEANILPKANEAIWLLEKKVIKFSTDQDFICKRVSRSLSLQGYIPEILGSTKFMYSYKRVNGQILSGCLSVKIFKKLLEWLESFWFRDCAKLERDQRPNYKDINSFYLEKTCRRIQEYLVSSAAGREFSVINGRYIPCVMNIIEELDWASLAEIVPCSFHGDLHPENILYDEVNDEFILLDWRHDFAGHGEVGDLYYDLGKLLHGLIMSHKVVVDNDFVIDFGEDSVDFKFKRSDISVDCANVLKEWCARNGLGYERVNIMASLIFLNIAALHHKPYCHLLFNLGKYMLYDAIAGSSNLDSVVEYSDKEQ